MCNRLFTVRDPFPNHNISRFCQALTTVQKVISFVFFLDLTRDKNTGYKK